jgi:chemotaxis response regulator CheB
MLMSSAAGVFGEGLIAVVLTGTGSDGVNQATPRAWTVEEIALV